MKNAYYTPMCIILGIWFGKGVGNICIQLPELFMSQIIGTKNPGAQPYSMILSNNFIGKQAVFIFCSTFPAFKLKIFVCIV